MPEGLAAVIMKLLSQDPQQRYQTTKGALHDLSCCLERFRESGRVDTFALGSRDAAPGFDIPDNLFGRDNELRQLLEALARVRAGATALVLISGPAGIGKSKLVSALRPDALRGGLYAAGKFDQFRPNEPCSVIVQTFRTIANQMISGEKEVFDAWKQDLQRNLGPNASLLASLIPEMDVILGGKDAICELPAVDELARFQWVFRSFVKTVARPGQTLCLFLDDVQWADPESLQFVNQLLGDRSLANLLIIVAYRTAELAGSAGLANLVAQLRQAPVDCTEVALQGLDLRSVSEIVFSAFCRNSDAESLLAEELERRCAGNPFYINQLLRSLHQEGAIAFDYNSGTWRCDEASLETLVPADLLQVVAERLQFLSEDARRVLSIAACLGSNFKLADLQLVTGRGVSLLAQATEEARKLGMVLQTGSPKDERSDFHFLHDRIQQEAFQIIPEGDRAKTRLEIGMAFLKKLEGGERHQVPFFVVDNLNAGASAAFDPSILAELAELNLIVGAKAKDRAAYHAAFQYFQTAEGFLPEDRWTSSYEMTLRIYMEYFECAYMIGEVDRARLLFKVIISRTRSKSDIARAYCVAILLHSGLDRSQEAVELGLEALRYHFGEDLPMSPGRPRLIGELIRVMVLLRGRQARQILNFPANKNEDQVWAMRLLMAICPAAYFRNPDLMSLAALRMMSISLRYGNTSESAYGYVLYGLTLGALFGRYDRGDEFGRLAVEISQRYGTAAEQCRILLIYAGFVAFWRRPFSECREILKEALNLARASGDIQYAHYSILQLMFLQLAGGDKLSEILREISYHEDLLGQNRDWFAQASYRVRKQFILALSGQTSAGAELSDSGYDEVVEARELRNAGNLTSYAYYLVAKTQLLFIFGEYQSALNYSDEAEKQTKFIQNQVSLAEHLVFRGLTASMMVQVTPDRSGRYRHVAKKCLDRVGVLSVNCPDNFECFHLLLRAQLASHDPRGDTEALFDRTIEIAKRTGQLQVEAIANELAARHYIRTLRISIARSFLLAAYNTYVRWGASAKATQLLETFASYGLAELLWDGGTTQSRSGERDEHEVLQIGALLDGAGIVGADVSAVEILRRQLAHLRNAAGGYRAILLSWDGDINRVQVEDPEQRRGAGRGFSERVANFVARTGTRVVAQNVRDDLRFAGCAYLADRSDPLGLICMPLYRQGRIVGSVYVERANSHGELAHRHIQILEMLSAQLAISLENARLAGTLEENDARLATALRNVDALQHSRNQLSLFVSDGLKALIESSEAGDAVSERVVDLSILFVDMAGYTSLSETVTPERLRTIVQTYFSRFLAEIHKWGGDLNEFAGDGLMITFQHPSEKEHARRAVATALAIRRQTDQQNLEAGADWAPVRFNIGIHSGEALIGATKLESPTGARWVYTATGFSTNLASRIGDAARGGQILVSGETASRVEGIFRVGGKAAMAFKGVSKPTDVFEILDFLEPE
ncbi:AAA family ATPase [Ensifer adhaerens]